MEPVNRDQVPIEGVRHVLMPWEKTRIHKFSKAMSKINWMVINLEEL